MKNSTKANIVLVGIVTAITGALLWYFSPANSEPNIWPKENFSKDSWKSLPASERYKQVRDLIDLNLLTDRSTAEVENLLGKPSYANPDDAYWTYIVKERTPGESGFDSVKMIHIDFNRSKHVTKVWVRGD